MNLTDYYLANKERLNMKQLTGPQQNLLFKLDDMGVDVGSGGPVTLRNPISGYTVPVADPFLAALVNWVYDTYSTYNYSGGMNYNGTKVAIGTFDRVKMLILSLYPNAYSNFID